MKRVFEHLVTFVYWVGVFWAVGVLFFGILANSLGFRIVPTDYFFAVIFAFAGFSIGWVVRYISLGETRLFP